MARMPDLFREAEEAVFGHHRHHHDEPAPGADPYPQTPATQPVNVAAAPAAAQPQQEETMSVVTTIEDETKNFLTEGLDYLVAQGAKLRAAAPGIIATSEAVAGSTVGQLAEIFLGKVLPPDVEAEFLALAKRYAASFGQPAVTDPAPTGQQPVQAPAQ